MARGSSKLCATTQLKVPLQQRGVVRHYCARNTSSKRTDTHLAAAPELRLLHAGPTKVLMRPKRDNKKTRHAHRNKTPPHQYLEFLAAPCRDAAQDSRGLELERPLFLLPLDSGRVEYVSSSRVEVGGHDRAEADSATDNEAAGEGQ